MEKIITKALEGGFNYERAQDLQRVGGKNAKTLFTPEFWKALGVACNWPDTLSPIWLQNALHFYEISLTEGWEKAIRWLERVIK